MGKHKFSKENVLYLVELLLFLALFISGLVKQPEAVYQALTGAQETDPGAHVEAHAEEYLPDSIGAMWQSETFGLTPGVYRIHVEAELPADSALTLSVMNQEPGVFRELLCNDLTMQAGQTDLTGSITVTAAPEKLCLQAAGSGNVDGIVLTSITVERTGQWNLVLAVCLLIGITLVNLLAFLRQMITKQRISGEQQMVIWGLAAAIVAAIFPSLTDYITVSGDTMWYLTRMEALAQGEMTVQAGISYLAIPAFFRRLGFTVQTSWQLFIWMITILTAVSSYCYLQFCGKDRKAALLVTVWYLLNPWRAALFYSDGNIAGWLGLNLLVLPAGILLFLLRKTIPCSVLGKVLAVLTVITVSITFYQLNDLAFHLAPEYLYDITVWGWETQVRSHGMGSMTDVWAAIAVLVAAAIPVAAIVAAVIHAAVIRSSLRGGKSHENVGIKQ